MGRPDSERRCQRSRDQTARPYLQEPWRLVESTGTDGVFKAAR